MLISPLGTNTSFSKEYYPKTKDYDAGYGMKDKIFMKESAHYIEQLPQPFYAKIITGY